MIYFDNASSTKLNDLVFEEMMIWQRDFYANPSSNHKFARKSKVAIENSRNKVAELLGVKPSEVFFTSSATESNNCILQNAVKNLKIKEFITSKLEHDSVFQTIQKISLEKNIKVFFVRNNIDGDLDLNSLEILLKKSKKPFVSLMHINNEISNINDIYSLSEISKRYGAFFHTDCVQSLGKINFKIDDNFDYISASSHKFHGPKGCGIIYAKNANIESFIYGGSQERNLRAGTENVSSIVGFAKALEISIKDLDKNFLYVENLKKIFIEKILKEEKIKFNGNSGILEKSSPYILNIGIENQDEENFLIYSLDSFGICATASSACSSGVEKKSRVIENLKKKISPIRISLSIYNNENEINFFFEKLHQILNF